MAFVDELTIYAKAGDGGDGVVRFRHEKYKEFGGPSGGNGGNGGDVYLVGVRDVGRLGKYAHNPRFLAENGEEGRGSSQYGGNGTDLEISIPIGSFARDTESGETYDILIEGERIQILRGGQGGLGNEHFKSSTNQTPQEATQGSLGGEVTLKIEVRLIADGGFIGLPNAGKSSLLNSLTNAQSKIGSYSFTTLEPHLGSMRGIILADIPGLIEGASEGKGLGHNFLRHIMRTRLLIHCVSLEHKDLMAVYEGTRKELEAFSPELIEKPELVVLTKSDEATPEHVKATQKLFPGSLVVSVLEDESVKALDKRITQFVAQNEKSDEMLE